MTDEPKRWRGPLALRLWMRVEVTSTCWNWLGHVNPGGYGQLRRENGIHVLVHRAAYEMLRGEIPIGLQLDHLCRNRRCVNPQHLEPVTAHINQVRGVGFAGVNFAKTHCPQGHPYTHTNNRGARLCRTCGRAAGLRYLRKRKAA